MATLAIFASREGCKNACWGTSPNPVGCGSTLPRRALRRDILSQRENAGEQHETVPQRCYHYLTKVEGEVYLYCPLVFQDWNPLKIGRFHKHIFHILD